MRPITLKSYHRPATQITTIADLQLMQTVSEGGTMETHSESTNEQW